jgi:hypothetical protein
MARAPATSNAPAGLDHCGRRLVEEWGDEEAVAVSLTGMVVINIGGGAQGGR